MSKLLGITFRLLVTQNSCGLFTSLYTELNSIGKSIRDDLNGIRYERETAIADDIIWTPEKVN